MRTIATESGDAPELALLERESFRSVKSTPGGPDAAAEVSEASMRHEPRVVVAGRNAAAMLPATLRRLMRQQTRLLVWADDAPSSWQLARRLALHIADAVLVGDEMAEAAVTRAGKPARAVFTVPGPYAIDAFLSHPPGRAAAAVYRLVVCGGLAPGGDGLTILASAAAWAERHASKQLELCWLGNGDLRGVLAAQSLPDNLVQHFAGALDLAGTAAEFLRSGVLVAGASSYLGSARLDSAGNGLACEGELLAQAMASGLVVLFDRDCPVACRLLRHGVTGIGYHAGRRGGLLDGLSEVLQTPASTLDHLRDAARMRVLPMNPQGYRERLGRAVESVMRDAAGRPGSSSFASTPVMQAR